VLSFVLFHFNRASYDEMKDDGGKKVF